MLEGIPKFFNGSLPKMLVTVSVMVTEIWPINRGYGYAWLNRDTPTGLQDDTTQNPPDQPCPVRPTLRTPSVYPPPP